MSILFLVWSISRAQGQANCSGASQQARDNCQAALGLASLTSGSSAGGSVSQAAASQIVAAASARDAMTAARQYCEDQKTRCDSSCSAGGGGSELPRPTCIGKNCKDGRPTGPIEPCDDKSPNCSPLVVQIGGRKLAMTAPESGAWFDILGLNAPTPHQPVHVSWPDRGSRSDNYFLTLPWQSAEVLGIDQLFGNNTEGPDASRPFAQNGFKALEKYDGRRADGSVDSEALDRRIDERDQVFGDLRLWHDVNGNGLAEYDELHTLDELGVVAIDLNYDPDYEESDEYGNRIKYKSTVDMRDGSLRLIFDLWVVSGEPVASR